jgi:uncharacterized coiled-coil protein SlyX
MADLRGALLAAAEEAEKMQKEAENYQKRVDYLEVRMVEQQNTINNLESHIDYIECENNKLRIKLKNIADYMRSIGSILSED